MPPTLSKHIVSHALPAWGHNKPIAALAVIITRARPDVIFTMLTTGQMHAKYTRELKSKLSTEEYEALSPRINLIDVVGNGFVDPFAPLPEFAPAYAAVYNGESITCKSSGKTFSGLPPPVTAIVDPFGLYAYEAIRAISQRKVTIVSWFSGPAGPLLQAFGPKALGGVTAEALETEAGLQEAKKALLTENTEAGSEPDSDTAKAEQSDFELVSVPGAPKMYIHEWSPQITVIPGERKFIELGRVCLRLGDGMIEVSNSVYEPKTVQAMKGWLQSIGQPSFVMAPLSLPKPKGTRNRDDKEVLNFLDRMKDRFGARSLIYISFGTLFYPPQQEKLQALIETLIAKQTPFIFTHASPLVQPSGDLLASIKESGIGLDMTWSPQETILQHDVTGWFITHGGWNSIQESFEYQVPLIFWPIGADQPVNAAQLGLVHKAAFELIEVRSGEQGTKPMLRFKNSDYKPTFTIDAVREEVEKLLVRIQGEEGRMVRANFSALSDKMGRSWDEGAESRLEVDRYLKTFVDCEN